MRWGNGQVGSRPGRLLALLAAAMSLNAVGSGICATVSSAAVGSGITFVGPAVRELPTELEFLSSSQHLTAGSSCHTGTYPGPTEPCDAYLVAYEGPDPSGLYHFRFNLPAAEPGDVHLEAQTPSGDHLAVEFTATNSGTLFGDARTCLMPGTNAEGQVAFELGFYGQMSTTAVVFSQEREGHRWVPPRLKTLANYPVGGVKGVEPYTRRTLRFHIDADLLSAGKVRLLYFLMKGDHPRISPKQRRRALRGSSAFSTAACLPPGGI